MLLPDWSLQPETTLILAQVDPDSWLAQRLKYESSDHASHSLWDDLDNWAPEG